MALGLRVLSILAFTGAAAVAVGASVILTDLLEQRSEAAVGAALDAAGTTDFAIAQADGLRVTVSGTAPDEAARFAAITAAGAAISPDRIIDALDVAEADALAPPDFSLELLRNEDGISLIGIVPAETDRENLIARLGTLGDVVDMVESADYTTPARWISALEFGLNAAELIPRSKISLSARQVRVTALAESRAQKEQLESRLRRISPPGLVISLDIAAPRPALTPFTLRFTKDENGARFSGCAAETARDRGRILASAEGAGLPPGADCTLALGAPSPRWPDAAVAGIEAVGRLGGGTLAMSDADISLVVPEGTDQALFARVSTDLESKLPDLFALSAILPEPEAERPGIFDPEALRFTGTLSPEGLAQLRGHVADESRQEVTRTLARALFGGDNVYDATEVSQSAQEGWSLRVLAGLEGLGQLHNGAVTVTPAMVELTGRSGNEDSAAELARLLHDRLGQDADIRLNVRYDPVLDPKTSIPTEEECFARIETVKSNRKITFDPGSARLAGDAWGLIEDIAEVLSECAHVPMEIAGHTDSQGREVMNLDLSQQRADAVLAALATQRLSTANLVARGYGEALPVADNDTAEGREENRRIEFTRPTPPVNSGAERAERPETDSDAENPTGENDG